jgi:PadR family transcriptional regulator, regulatory protein PadR
MQILELGQVWGCDRPFTAICIRRIVKPVYGPKVRCRWQVRPGHWAVRARVERLIEPAVLLQLRERPRHGYDLLENIPALVGDGADVDLGNLYRLLRGLEAEGMVSSRWHVDAPGPARRIYTLTPAGGRLLDAWAAALRATESVVATFLARYDHGERRTR